MELLSKVINLYMHRSIFFD